MKNDKLNKAILTEAILTVIKAGYSVHSSTHWISDQSEWHLEPTFNVTRRRHLRGTLYTDPQEAVEFFLEEKDS